LEQSLSIERSLKSLDAFILENHLRSHVKHQMQHRGEEEKAVKGNLRRMRSIIARSPKGKAVHNAEACKDKEKAGKEVRRNTLFQMFKKQD